MYIVAVVRRALGERPPRLLFPRIPLGGRSPKSEERPPGGLNLKLSRFNSFLFRIFTTKLGQMVNTYKYQAIMTKIDIHTQRKTPRTKRED